MKKNILALLAVSALVLTACGNSAPDDEKLTPPTSVEVEETSASAEETTAGTEPAVEAIATVPAPSAKFPEVNISTETADVDFTIEDAKLPEGYEPAYIVKNFSFYNSVLSQVNISVMDSHDNEIYSTIYDMENKEPGMPQYTKRTYNSDGKMTYMAVSYDKNEVAYSTEYTYDENGFLVADNSHSGDIKWYHNYTNDGYGNPVSVDAHDAVTDSVITHEYTYDTNGNILTHTIAGGDVMGEGKIVFEYDEKGRLVKQFNYPKKTTFTNSIEYAYDDSDNEIMVVHKTVDNGSESIDVTIYKDYDEKGRLTRQLDKYGDDYREDSYTLYEYTDLT